MQITSQESDLLQHIIKALSHEISDSEGQPFHDEIIRSYVDLFIYKLCSIISKDLKNSPAVESSVKSRNEEYFHKFMHVLANNYKSERSVGFYASQLCITPKYLTTLIKKVSGKSAAEWIDNYVILEAKNLLRYSTMSIQEVAYYLNFSNQSFFGKYFKHQTGMSPSAYKMQNRGGKKIPIPERTGRSDREAPSAARKRAAPAAAGGTEPGGTEPNMKNAGECFAFPGISDSDRWRNYI